MAGETTTEESEEVEVDDEWERAMSNSTATAGSVKMVACPYDGCPWFSSKRKRLERHLLTHTGERPFACQEEGCTATYTRSDHLRKHVDKFHRKIRFPCAECTSTFSSPDGVAKHVKTKHSKDSHSYRCDECGKTFTKRNHLQCHVASHDKVLPHGCKICGERFLYPSKLKRHQVRYHDARNKKRYPCPKKEGFDCTKDFETWSEARKHAQEHRTMHRCEICRAEFKLPLHLKEHVATKHDGDESNTYRCAHKDCDRIYHHARNLHAHIRSAHLSNGLICDYSGCGREFAHKKSLNHHVRLHAERGLDVRPDYMKKGSVVRKPAADRKDKGSAKKSMAAILSSVAPACSNLNLKSEKRLLKDAVFGLDAGEIESQINDDKNLAEGLLNIGDGNQSETETAELCRKKYSNVRKVEQAMAKERFL